MSTRNGVGAALLLLGLCASALAQPRAPLGFKAIAATERHSIAVVSDGTVWEWGARFHCEDWFERADRRAEVFDRTWS
jgi:hypothetical protein